MSEKIPLYKPLYTLKPISKNIWIADWDIVKMWFFLFKAPFSTRMTIIKLNDGSLWIHSPIAPNKNLLKEIDLLGKVRYLVSPNKIHYVHISAWKKIYPDAIAFASPWVEKRAKSQKIEVNFDKNLEEKAPIYWESEIEQIFFKWSRFMQEVDFFHKESRTLILTDMIENFEVDKMDSCFLKILMKLAWNADPNGKTPLDFRMTFLWNKKLARESFEKIIAWKPEKVILAHWRCYLENAGKELKRAFSWLY